MRKILIIWAATVVLFWGWHFVSYYDLGPTFFFSKNFHAHMYGIYAQVLNIPASEVPIKVAWVFVFDTFIVFGIAALRWYKRWLPQLLAFIKSKLGFHKADENDDNSSQIVNGPVHPAE